MTNQEDREEAISILSRYSKNKKLANILIDKEAWAALRTLKPEGLDLHPQSCYEPQNDSEKTVGQFLKLYGKKEG